MRASALEAVPFSRNLAASATLWPTDDLWLAGHRALREIPRVAAVWEFVAAELRKSLRD